MKDQKLVAGQMARPVSRMKYSQHLITVGAVFAALSIHAVSLENFPRLTGETDDTGRLQRAVDSACEDEVTIPSGIYLVSKPIAVTNYCSLALANRAVIRAIKTMPYVIDMQLGPHRWMRQKRRMIDLDIYNLSMIGGTIDGNGLADCMRLDHHIHFTMRDVTFLNGRKVGLTVSGGWEMIADNLYFKTLMSGLAGNVALDVNCGDNHFTDVIAVDYTVGIRIAGGANRFTRCHVWGGEVPPRNAGGIAEMLVGSVGFWLVNAGGNVLRDCYADTCKTGFRVECSNNMLLGCRYFNSPRFKLDDVLIIDHAWGNLLVKECIFSKELPHTRVYEGPGTVVWKDNLYYGFKPGDDCPGSIRFVPEQTAKTPDEWRLLPNARPYKFEAAPDAFAQKGSYRAYYADLYGQVFAERFPKAGPGKALIVRARALHPQTKRVEVALTDDTGRRWKKLVPLTMELQTIRIPFDAGGFPDVRRLTNLAFCFGNFLCDGHTDVPHGYEVVDVRIEQ